MRWLVTALATAGALALSACGGMQPASSRVIRRAAHLTLASQGADVSASGTLTTGDGSIQESPSDLTLVGSESFARHQALATLRLSRAGRSLTAAVRLRYPVAYVNSAFLLPPGHFGRLRWVRLNLASRLRRPEADPALLVPAQCDPERALAYLEMIRGRPAELGTESIRGVPTTHYQAISGIHVQGAKRIPVDVWIDREHLVRQMRITLSLSRRTPPTEAKAVLTIDLFNFGPKRSVDPPPIHQTIGLGAFTAGIGQ
jgi:hypothetical protein